MMKSYLIIYRLYLPESSYGNLIAYLKTAPLWARPFDSVWFIKAGVEAASIRDGIRSRINTNDKVLVIEVNNTNWGTSNVLKEVTDWMKNNL